MVFKYFSNNSESIPNIPTFDRSVNKTIEMKDVIDFGAMIYQLRTEHGLSQKVVADKIGIDISMLSKIENGERQLQPHMLSSIADLFELNAEKLKVDFLANKITEEYGKYPHFKKSLKKCLTN